MYISTNINANGLWLKWFLNETIWVRKKWRMRVLILLELSYVQVRRVVSQRRNMGANVTSLYSELNECTKKKIIRFDELLTSHGSVMSSSI